MSKFQSEPTHGQHPSRQCIILEHKIHENKSYYCLAVWFLYFLSILPFVLWDMALHLNWELRKVLTWYIGRTRRETLCQMSDGTNLLISWNFMAWLKTILLNWKSFDQSSKQMMLWPITQAKKIKEMKTYTNTEIRKLSEAEKLF